MVYRVVYCIWALVLGLWLWEHGWHQAGQIALAFTIGLGVVLVYAFWPLVLLWLVWPRRAK